MLLIKNFIITMLAFVLYGCVLSHDPSVILSHGEDESAGGGPAYIVSTPAATYYLEKEGGGLSSLLDPDGVDWLGFHNKQGSGHKGEYRGFPNAIHRQDGNYFHAMNTGTDRSTSIVNIDSDGHVRITFSSANNLWEGQWDFFPDRCDFTMTKVSSGYKYWVLYEGVPGGEMDAKDYWLSSANEQRHAIKEASTGDLPAPEWMAFGDTNVSRVLYVLHHTDDNLPDNYVSRPDMTVLGFGRQNKDKYLTTPQKFSIGFVESTDYKNIADAIRLVLADK